MTARRRPTRSARVALVGVLVAVFGLAGSPHAQTAAPTDPPAATAAPTQVDDAPAPEPINPGEREIAQAVKQAVAPGAHDLSPWVMFLNADILVKIVMSGLALASVIPGAADGIKERSASRCSEIVKAEGRTARRGMGALATIGAISPFVGLFGTVWGIMNSFIGISKAQTTNLAVVAPGIAEALLATAIGLAAAIPAVIIYNHFARATRGYGDLVGRASGAAMRLLSRDLDRERDYGFDRDHGHDRRVRLARAGE